MINTPWKNHKRVGRPTNLNHDVWSVCRQTTTVCTVYRWPEASCSLCTCAQFTLYHRTPSQSTQSKVCLPDIHWPVGDLLWMAPPEPNPIRTGKTRTLLAPYCQWTTSIGLRLLQPSIHSLAINIEPSNRISLLWKAWCQFDPQWSSSLWLCMWKRQFRSGLSDKITRKLQEKSCIYGPRRRNPAYFISSTRARKPQSLYQFISEPANARHSVRYTHLLHQSSHDGCVYSTRSRHHWCYHLASCLRWHTSVSRICWRCHLLKIFPGEQHVGVSQLREEIIVSNKGEWVKRNRLRLLIHTICLNDHGATYMSLNFSASSPSSCSWPC